MTRWTPDALPGTFWKTIERAEGERAKLRPLLEAMSQTELGDFYRAYEAAREALRDPEYFKPDMSEDTLEDIVMWVIATGEATYRDVHDHPDKLPATLPSRKGLGYADLAARIHQDRFGVNLFDLFHD